MEALNTSADENLPIETGFEENQANQNQLQIAHPLEDEIALEIDNRRDEQQQDQAIYGNMIRNIVVNPQRDANFNPIETFCGIQ